MIYVTRDSFCFLFSDMVKKDHKITNLTECDMSAGKKVKSWSETVTSTSGSDGEILDLFPP